MQDFRPKPTNPRRGPEDPAPTPDSPVGARFTPKNYDTHPKPPQTRPLLFILPQHPRAGLSKLSVGIRNCLENLPLHRNKIPKTRPLLFKNRAGYPKTPKRAGLVQFSVGILNCLENLPLHRKNSVGAGLPCYLSISTPRSQKPALFYSKTTPGIPKPQRGQVWFNFLWVSEIVW